MIPYHRDLEQRVDGAERHDAAGAAGLEVPEQVRDELGLRAHARVADPRCEEALAVKDAQQIHQVRLRDRVHRVVFRHMIS